MSIYRSLSFKVAAADTELRTETLDDEDYSVIPVVALVEGVLHPSNAENPELALASEFGKVPAGWNGRPIILGHPKNEDGEPVSANSPGLWSSKVLGMMFNTKLDDKKLKAEMWINKAKAGENLLKRFTEETVEVSTGLFAQTEKSKGTFNGEDYFGIWRDIVPDHLAILDEGTRGACSVEDGCGAPRVNKAQIKEVVVAHTCTCGAGGIGGGPCTCAPKTLTAAERKELTATFDKLYANAKDRSDGDTRMALESALLLEDSDPYYYVASVFKDTFVYMCYKEGNYHTLRRGYRIKDDGTVVLSKDTQEVRPETDYVPVSVSIQQQPKGDDSMTEEQKALAVAEAKVKELQAALDTEKAANTKANEQITTLTKVNTETLQALEVANKKPKTLDEYVAAAPEPFKAELTASVAAVKAYREGLVTALSEKTSMTKEELGTLDMSILEKMSKGMGLQVEGTTFAGAAPAAKSTTKTNEAFTPPLEAFPRKTATAAAA